MEIYHHNARAGRKEAVPYLVGTTGDGIMNSISMDLVLSPPLLCFVFVPRVALLFRLIALLRLSFNLI
jgi:hypothetical protein